MSKWFSDTGVDISQSELRQLNIPELAEITFSSPISSESLISTVLLLFIYILLPGVRFLFPLKFPQIPFTAINTKKKLDNYINPGLSNMMLWIASPTKNLALSLTYFSLSPVRYPLTFTSLTFLFISFFDRSLYFCVKSSLI